MKVVILAAGYGTRLERDLRQNGNFKELHGVPKPLLPVAGRPVLSHWLDILSSCQETKGEVYVVVGEGGEEEEGMCGREVERVELSLSSAGE